MYLRMDRPTTVTGSRQKSARRKLAADLIGARSEQVAFTRNTSDGLSTVANGLSWRAGDNVVTFQNEFPSNIYPELRLHEGLLALRFVCPGNATGESVPKS